MKFILLVLSIVVFIGCGSDDGSNQKDSTNQNQMNESEKITVNALVLYDTSTRNLYINPETKINQLIEVTNKIMNDSNLNVEINVTEVVEINFSSNMNYSKSLSSISINDEVNRIKKNTNSDIVIVYRRYLGDGLCGIGYLMNELSYDLNKYSKEDRELIYSYTVSIVGINCAADTTAHEIGHSFGLSHSYRQDDSHIMAYPYSRGHGVENEFTTVMAYSSAYNSRHQLYRYSDPESLECYGKPCGIHEGEEHQADAVKALKKTIPNLKYLTESLR